MWSIHEGLGTILNSPHPSPHLARQISNKKLKVVYIRRYLENLHG